MTKSLMTMDTSAVQTMFAGLAQRARQIDTTTKRVAEETHVTGIPVGATGRLAAPACDKHRGRCRDRQRRALCAVRVSRLYPRWRRAHRSTPAAP